MRQYRGRRGFATGLTVRIVLCGLTLWYPVCWGAPHVAPALPTLAVIDLVARGVSGDDVSMISEKLRTEIVKLGKFTVLERAQMDEILKEQGFQKANCSDNACVVQAGKLMGVQKMVAGTVGTLGGQIILSVRLVGVETAKIEKTVEKTSGGELLNVYTTLVPRVARMLACSAAEIAQIGRDEEAKGRLQSAVDWYTDAIESSGGKVADMFDWRAETWASLADSASPWKTGDFIYSDSALRRSLYMRAVEDLGQAIALKPTAQTLYMRAWCRCFKLGGWDVWGGTDGEIAQDLVAAMKLDSTLLEAVRMSAEGCEWAGRTERLNCMSLRRRGWDTCGVDWRKKAVKYYTKAIALDPKDVDLLSSRASLLEENGDHRQAVKDYTTAITFDPKNSDLYKSRANSLKEDGAYRSAIKDYTVVIDALATERDNDLELALILKDRAECYMALGEWEKAFADHKKMVKLGGDDWSPNSYWYWAADSLRSADKCTEAANFYTNAISLTPSDSINDLIRCLAGRTECYWKLGQSDMALRDCGKVADLARRTCNSGTLESAWRCCRNAGSGDQCEESMGGLFKCDSALAYRERSSLRRQRGDLEGAVQDLTMALKYRESSAERRELGVQKAREIHSDLLLARGEILRELNRPAEAAIDYRRYLQTWPKGDGAEYARAALKDMGEERPADWSESW